MKAKLAQAKKKQVKKVVESDSESDEMTLLDTGGDVAALRQALAEQEKQMKILLEQQEKQLREIDERHAANYEKLRSKYKKVKDRVIQPQIQPSEPKQMTPRLANRLNNIYG
jgi:hypothetical protein